MVQPLTLTQKTQCKDNIVKDFKTGVLKKEDGIQVFGFGFSQDRYVYDSAKNKEKTGKELTLGELKERYCIDKPGALKEMNQLFVGTVDDRGTSLDKHYPSEVNAPKVNIPTDLIEKTLDTKG